MNTPVRPVQPTQKPGGMNPFAAALAEARGGQPNNQLNTFGNAPGANEFNNFNFEEQQRKMIEQQKRERLRMQLHRQINPVETIDIFNAKQEQVTKQINDIRHELKLLSQEINEFNNDIEISLIKNVAEPGTDGTYYFSFFQKLKAFILLLREKIHSARAWANTFQAKQRKRRKGAGLEITGKSYEQTATVFDRMHHERSAVYSGS